MSAAVVLAFNGPPGPEQDRRLTFSRSCSGWYSRWSRSWSSAMSPPPPTGPVSVSACARPKRVKCRVTYGRLTLPKPCDRLPLVSPAIVAKVQ